MLDRPDPRWSRERRRTLIRLGTWRRFWSAAAGLAVGLLAGCNGTLPVGVAAYSAGMGREAKNPAPISRMKKSEAMMIAKLWASSDLANRSFTTVLPTGSMLPVLDSNSILLMERVTAGELRKNDIAIYQSGKDGMRIVHRAKEVTRDGVYFEGDANSRSDGWIASDQVRWRIAGILYTSPQAPDPAKPDRSEPAALGQLLR